MPILQCPTTISRLIGNFRITSSKVARVVKTEKSAKIRATVLQIISSTSSGATYTLEFGSLSGGSPLVFASITNVQLATVGWTIV